MDLYNLYAKVILDTDEYTKDLKEATNQGKQASESISASTIAMGTILGNVIQKGASALVNLGKSGVAYNAQIEKYTVAITTALGGTAEAAQQAAVAIENIKQDAARTPFSVEGLVSANQYLLAAGESAEGARKTIMALSDAVSASGGGNVELQRMAQNLQQIKNTGEATAQDIKQFANAGINVYGILADYTGMTVEQTKDLAVTYDLLNEALIAAASEGGRFFDANIAQSQTLNGQISTLQDNIQSKLGEAFEGITDVLKSDVLPALNDFVQAIDVDEIVSKFDSVATAVAGIMVALNANKVISGVAAIGGAAKALATPWSAVTLAVTGSVIAAQESVGAWENMVDGMTDVGDSSEDVRAQIADLEQQLIDMGADDVLFFTTATDEEAMAATAARTAIAELTAKLAELEGAERLAAEQTAATNDSMGNTGGVTQEMAERIQDLAAQYEEAYGKIRESVGSYFGMFEQAVPTETANIEEMIAALQSQQEWNNNFANNLDTINNYADEGGEAFQGLAEQLGATGEKGAEYAAAIAAAIEAGDKEAIDQLTEAWQGVQQSQDELAQKLSETTSQFGALRDQAVADLQEISGEIAAIPERKDVWIYVHEVVGSSVSGSHATGLDYVPFDNYVANLHKGERVLTASENKSYNSNGNSSYGSAEPQPIVADITLEIDGAVLAKKTYQYNRNEAEFHGDSLIKT